MQTVLIFAELVIAVALIIFVLLQRSEGGALGMGGGGGGGMGGLFSPRGAADTLTRTTAILGALFFLICLGLNLLALHGRNEGSFLDSPSSTTAPLKKPALPAGSPFGPQVPKPQ
jgi:preprotein translocase subunit SecG